MVDRARLKSLTESKSIVEIHNEDDRHRVIAESQTPIFNPYSNNMWVIRVEDYLAKVTKKKWTWKKPILKNGNQITYRWLGRKSPNGLVAPRFTVGYTYNKGHDLFDIEVLYHDGNQSVTQKRMKQVPIENVMDPEVLFHWVRGAWPKLSKKAKAPKADIDAVVSDLKDNLKTPTFSKGIHSATIAYAYKISKTAASAALRRLEKEGLIYVKPGYKNKVYFPKAG